MPKQRIRAADTRRLRLEAERIKEAAARLQDSPDAAKRAIHENLDKIRRELAHTHLKSMPVKKIREVTEGRLRLGPIEEAGYLSVADVLARNESTLALLPGIGAETARKTMAAARQIQSLMMKEARIRLDPDSKPDSHTQILLGIRAYEEIQELLDEFKTLRERANELDALILAAHPLENGFRRLFIGRKRRESAESAHFQLEGLVEALGGEEAATEATDSLNEIFSGRSGSELWADYEKRAAEYWGLLGELAQLTPDDPSAFGYLPQEIVAKVQSQDLDPGFLKVSLRGYQAFGAKFALVQGKVIIGDEMGLGKTIEALAMMAHLSSLGMKHFLVVCPASVIINWTQEIDRRTKLPHFRLHGWDRDWTFDRWISKGGVAVTTFGTLRALPGIPEGKKLPLLVVDEAHYVKNPSARRTLAVRVWVEMAHWVLYLTGTPMENRVDEFESLVSQLNPEVARALPTRAAVAGPTAFRRAVAPVYLRRNQEDVLSELPDLLSMDDWVELSDSDLTAYRESVAAGNFMSMRQAAYAPNGGHEPAKLKRLLEIAEESASNGWKMVVFSYFRSVLHRVHSALDGLGVGIIHGGVRPADRQAMVDSFTERRGPGVLVSQIEAGGVGLNLQAASVVVLAEPQWKPTTEAQAVARCHRMGQVRRVHAHRLLAKDYVDERMLEILGGKARLFDEYVRESALKEATSDAIDISEVEAARKIVEIERERLGIETPI